MLKILEFMFSGPLKFIGCFFILLLILALIEGAIANICKTIIASKALKYNKYTDLDIKSNIRDIISGKTEE